MHPLSTNQFVQLGASQASKGLHTPERLLQLPKNEKETHLPQVLLFVFIPPLRNLRKKQPFLFSPNHPGISSKRAFPERRAAARRFGCGAGEFSGQVVKYRALAIGGASPAKRGSRSVGGWVAPRVFFDGGKS